MGADPSRGRVLTRTELIARAWSLSDGLHERSVDAHIKSLRRKLGDRRYVVETVRGLGYRFAPEARAGFFSPRRDPSEVTAAETPRYGRFRRV